jgi:hypothetical protein
MPDSSDPLPTTADARGGAAANVSRFFVVVRFSSIDPSACSAMTRHAAKRSSVSHMVRSPPITRCHPLNNNTGDPSTSFDREDTAMKLNDTSIRIPEP